MKTRQSKKTQNNEFPSLNCVLDYVIVVDPNSNILFLNPPFLEQKVIEPHEDWFRKNLYEIFPEFEDERLPDLIEEVITTKRQRYVDNFLHATRKEAIPTRYRLLITPEFRNDVVEDIVLCFNWVGRERVYLELADSLRRLIVHRIRADVGRLKRICEELDPSVSNYPEVYAKVEGLISSLRDRIWSIADTSDKVGLITKAVEVEPTNLRDLTERIIENRSKLKKRVNWYNKVPENLVILGSPTLIEEVIEEFIQNAHRYMREGCDIEVRAEIIGSNSVEIAVKNTGSRIPTGILKFIEDNKPLEADINVRSTGIGIFLVKQALAYYYDGKALVNIRNEKDGVSVKIRIPIQRESVA